MDPHIAGLLDGDRMPSGHSRRRRGERLSRRRMLLIAVAAVVLWGLIICAILYFGDRFDHPQKENYGSLEGRFADPVTVEYEDQTFEYRGQDFINVLLLGVDREAIDGSDPDVRGNGQADFLLLLSIDRERKTVTPVQLDRDTVTPVQIYGALGNPAGFRNMQLCLSYAFGDSPKAGSENAAKAVSDLLGGIRIDHYLSMDMNGMAALNDALGGITVTLNEDFSDLDPAMTKGTTLTLHGRQAEYFLRGRRYIGDGLNTSRMERQRAFMDEAVRVLTERMDADTDYINHLLDELEPHLYTNTEKGVLANLAVSYGKYQRTDIRTVDGTHAVNEDGFMEFYPDPESMKALLLDMYFE